MLTKPDEKLLTAVMGLGASGTLVEIIKFLESEREKARDQLEVVLDDVRIRQLQGEAQFLTEFLETLRDAPALMTKLKAGRL